MGVHTGDSVCVAPQQTLTDKQYQALRDQAIAVIRAVGVETGGLQRPVRGQPGHRRDRGDRDEPARVALERAGQQGHRLPDRQDRRPAGRRLHAAGDPQRHHQGHPGQLRARDRLLRGQVAAVRVREVPRRRGRADHPHEVGRRGDGARADVQAGVRQGAALARARHPPAIPEDDEALLAAGRAARAPSASTICSRRCAAGVGVDELARRTSIDPWFLHELARARRPTRDAAHSPASGRSRRWTPARPSSPPRRPTSTRAGSARARAAPEPRGRARGERPGGGHPRARARTGSGRGSSSTTAASTPPRRSASWAATRS